MRVRSSIPGYAALAAVAAILSAPPAGPTPLAAQSSAARSGPSDPAAPIRYDLVMELSPVEGRVTGRELAAGG